MISTVQANANQLGATRNSASSQSRSEVTGDNLGLSSTFAESTNPVDKVSLSNYSTSELPDWAAGAVRGATFKDGKLVDLKTDRLKIELGNSFSVSNKGSGISTSIKGDNVSLRKGKDQLSFRGEQISFNGRDLDLEASSENSDLSSGLLGKLMNLFR